MKRRLVVITEIIAPYRIPVFNALAQVSDLDLQVIFLAENDPDLRKWLVYKNELQFPYRVLSSWRASVAGVKVLLNWGMARTLRDSTPDAIICGGYNDPADWVAWSWARRKAIPFFSWVESNLNDQRSSGAVRLSLKRRYLRGCSGVIVPGRASARYVEELGVQKNRIFTAPNAVDNELYAREAAEIRANAVSHRRALGLPDRYFLFVGRLVREKGVFDLIEAYGNLEAAVKEHVGLVLVGDGAARGDLEKRAQAISPGQVIFRGFQQRDQLVADYALAETFVFPTHSDPWGLAVNEAMACGLPVIATAVSGCAPDLVQPGVNGWVVAPRDPIELTRIMSGMARDGEQRALMGTRSQQIIANYSPESCAMGLAHAASSCWGAHVR